MSDLTLPEVIAESWMRERPDLDQLGLGLTVRIRALAMVIDHVIAGIAEGEGIQVDDMLLLFALRRRGAPYCLRPTEVYGILNITSGAATYRIDRLVKQQLCERAADPEDRRSYMLRISAHGMSVIDRAVERLAEESTRAIGASGLDSVQITALKTTLRQLEAGWEAIVPPAENPLSRRERTVLHRARNDRVNR